jgi:sterol desaturase/sphingolipid hydroxylase (fatty acid hydroxylase superfamily)
VLVLIGIGWLLLEPAGRLLDELPPLAQALVGLVLFEVFGYWYHRASHEIPFLWRFHAVHHSSERLDWLAAARLHPLEGFFGGLFIAPAFVLLGFRPAHPALFPVVTTTWAIVIHANVRWRLRWLDGIIGTPEWHHWHHSRHAEGIDKNYSGLLPVLDRLFGTYYLPTDRRPAVYGIDEPMPATWLGQLRHPLRRRPRPSPLRPF